MNAFQHISGEVACYINCIYTSPLAWVILALVAGAILLFITYLFISNPLNRIRTVVAGQVLIISAVWLSFTTMICNSMFSIDIYIIYTLTTLGIMYVIPKVYDRLLVKRLRASPLSDLIDWGQDFVESLVTGSKVYYFDSAIPRAFASRRSIFISVGLLEILDDVELKAVLAHESWHLMHSNKTHWLKQLSIMTFMPFAQSDLEQMADLYASGITGQDALDSARLKIFPEFNPL